MQYCAEVSPGLYIGSVYAAAPDICLQHNIKTIINLSSRDYTASDIPVVRIKMDDTNVTPDTIDMYICKFNTGVVAISNARNKGYNVLIHCDAGINRSATLIGMYLIHTGKNYNEMYALLANANRLRNTPLLTNPSFVCLLKAKEAFEKYKHA